MKEKQAKKSRNQKGITLVALVVTIVVLLILAGISLNLVLGQNGIVAKAKDAKSSYKEAEKKDSQDLDNLSKELEFMDSTVVYSKTDKDGNVIPIPNGYYYVEGTKDTGFVISDNKNDENKANASEGNQYVWVPVDNIDDYKLISWNGETVSEDVVEGADYYHSVMQANVTEPTISKNNSMITPVGRVNAGGGSNPGIIGYDAEEISIEQYGGFYIGRYEASYDEVNKKMESKKDKTPYVNSSINDIKNKIMSEVEGEIVDPPMVIGNLSKISTTEKVTKVTVEKLGMTLAMRDSGSLTPSTSLDKSLKHSMVTGKQWDAMIKWLNKTKGVSYNTIGHKRSSSINTGSNEEFKVNNIYDIAGNVSEYVDKEYYSEYNGSTNLNVYRGGNYTQENILANSRNHNDGSASPVIGTRLSLVLPLEISDTDMDGEFGNIK